MFGTKLLPRPLRLRVLSRVRPVSVVITCRNYGRYLQDSFESALNQTRRPAEIVIVDDESTDSTADVVRRLVESSGGMVHVNYVRKNVRLGVAGSRNIGVTAARSEYVAILDADDRLDSRYVECVASLLDRDSHVGVAYSSYREFDERNRDVILPPFDPVVLLTDCIIMGCAMIRKSVFCAVGGYDSEQIFEDWELWIRIVSKGWKAMGCGSPLYFYRVHSDSKDAEANQQRLEGERRIYVKHEQFYKAAEVTRLENGVWQNAKAAPPYR